MTERIIGPQGSKRRRRFLWVPMLLVACTALFLVAGAQAVHDLGVFQLDGDAQTGLQSTPTAAEDWDLICKANVVQVGTLAAAITSSQTSITVTETAKLAVPLPDNIQIGSEQMTVTARSGSTNPFTYTVTRHIDGTTAAAANSGAAVSTGCLFQKNATVPGGTTVGIPSKFIVDQSNTQVDDILKTGTKDDNEITSWSWTSAGSLDKNDLTDGAVAEYTCSDASANCAGHASDKLLYFMADRYGISGSANVAFWFFQNNVAQYADGTGSSAGQCVTSSGCAFTTDGNAPAADGSNLAKHVAGTCGLPNQPAPPACTWGDILVIGAFGPHASLNVFEWVGPGNATKNYNGTNSCFTAACSLQPVLVSNNGDCNQTPAINGDNACAVANTTVTPSPWILPQKNIQGKPVGDQFNADTVHGLSTFFEGGINLTGLGLGGTCFSSFLINSRSSSAGDSELHDKILGSFQRCTPNLATQQSVTANTDGTPGTVQPGTAVSDTATVAVNGATNPADATGTVDFTLCGPVASITSGTNVCDVTNVGTASAGTGKTLGNSANCNPASSSTTDGVSCAFSNSVNGTGAALANGYYCFKATAKLTNYASPDPATNNTTECFQVLQLATTIVTSPQSPSGTDNSGPFNLKDSPTVYDHAVVTGSAAGGFPEGKVTFYICTPGTTTGASGSEVCPSTAGTAVGSDKDVTHVSNETFKSEATSDGYSITSSSALGVYCFRAVFTPDATKNPVYTGVTDASTHSECFTLRNASTATSTQDWMPNDHITITPDAASIAGKITVQLVKGNCDPSATGASVVYTDTPAGGASFTAASGGTTYDTLNTTYSTAYKVSSTTATGDDYFWRAVFTPTSTFATGITKCEKSTLTINNAP